MTLICICASMLLFTRVAVAQDTPEPPDETSLEFGLSLSGGMSLGSYEAGSVYMLTEAAKKSQGALRLRLATGFSAGSANAFLAAVNACSPPNLEPTEDLGWKSWINIGHEELFVPEKVNSLGMLSIEPMREAAQTVRKRWMRGLDPQCDVVVGMVTTRVKPRRVALTSELDVPRQQTNFTLRLQGREGAPPKVTNYVDPDSPLPTALLATGDDDAAGFDAIISVIQASSAVPPAFRPQPIDYCVVEKGQRTCTESEQGFFVDGGFFVSNPLLLAYRIAAYGLAEAADGGAIWRDLSQPEAPEPSYQKLVYTFLDPTNTVYPPILEEERFSEDILGFSVDQSEDLVSTARSRELYTLVEDHPHLRDHIRLAKLRFPAFGELLASSLAFFERDLRRFDFYLGMYDACLELVEWGEGKYHPATFLGESPEDIPEGWHPTACMMGWYLPDMEAFRQNCAAVDENLLILMQVTLDRVYSHCEQLSEEDISEVDHYHCARAIAGEAPPQMDGVPERAAQDAWRRDERESHFAYVLRLLSDYRFEWRDLGLSRDRASRAKLSIRRLLLDMADAFIAEQDGFDSRQLLRASSRFAVDRAIGYEPARTWWYALIGSAPELGVSARPFEWQAQWLRAHFALQGRDVLAAIVDEDSVFRITPLAGAEFQLLGLSSTLIQTVIGVRAGYQFSEADDFSSDDCTSASSLGDGRRCSQFTLQTHLALSALERLRLQASAQFYPDPPEFEGSIADVLLGIGVQF